MYTYIYIYITVDTFIDVPELRMVVGCFISVLREGQNRIKRKKVKAARGLDAVEWVPGEWVMQFVSRFSS